MTNASILRAHPRLKARIVLWLDECEWVNGALNAWSRSLLSCLVLKNDMILLTGEE